MAKTGFSEKLTSHRGWRCALAVLAWAVFVPCGPASAGGEVDLELVLAIDSSTSVDEQEFSLQLLGLARAFRDPELLEAIRSGPRRAIAVTLVEWSSAWRQQVSIPWRLVGGASAAEQLANDLEAAPRLIDTGATSISEAIRFSILQFHGNGFAGFRRVIDISADGRNNQGAPLDKARRDADVAGVTVNALAVKNRVWALDAYFRDEVITGAAAFALQADDYEDYVEAIRRKLIREIRNTPVS
jgi:hypothetical protein